LREHGLIGSMGRRGNPYDNAKAESFMKTLKVEAVYLMDYQQRKSSCQVCCNAHHLPLDVVERLVDRRGT
jgi:transposase InsO family protein